MNTESVNYIVGDKFESISENDGMYTYSQVVRMTENGQAIPGLFMAGQGIHDEQMAYLSARGISFLNNDMCPAQNRYIHKHNKENIIVSDPVRLSKTEFTSSLCVHDGCAEMSDHVTGVHMAGNLLIEAVRQSSVACVEAFLLPAHYTGASRFVWDRFSVSFKGFIFPLETTINLTLTSEDTSRDERWKGEFDVEFYQMGTLGCEAEMQISTYPAEWMDTLETKKSEEACFQACMASQTYFAA